MPLPQFRYESSATSNHERRHPAIPPSPVALVRPAQARFAMAPGPRRLSRMAVGNNVAANASGGSAEAPLRGCEKVYLGKASGEVEPVPRFCVFERPTVFTLAP